MKLTPLSSDKLIKLLLSSGFEKKRQKGSHIFFKHPDGRVTTVPVYAGEEIGRNLFRKIINDMKLSRDEFLDLLKK